MNGVMERLTVTKKEGKKERKIALANEKETTGDGEDKLWSQERTNNRKADKRSNS